MIERIKLLIPKWFEIISILEGEMYLSELFNKYKNCTYQYMWNISRTLEEKGIITIRRTNKKVYLLLTEKGLQIQNNINSIIQLF